MGKQHEGIGAELATWIGVQQMFFVATAPLSARGHINTSPKGGDSFRILSPLEVVYQDYTGSGAETAAHLRENGRIVVMFCAFAGPPRIVRLHGCGEVISPGQDIYDALSSRFPSNPGTRAYVKIEITRIADSCGYAVPRYDFVEARQGLDRWAEKKGDAALIAYRRENNQRSIDGLAAFDLP